MKRVVIIAAAVLAGILLFWLSTGSPSASQQLSVQFLGFKKVPALGVCALLGVTNTTSHGFVITGMSLETKEFEDWHTSPNPALWQRAGWPATFGPHSMAIISMSQGRGFVAVVAKPNAGETWRVRVDGQDEHPIPVMLLRWITRGWSDLYFEHKSSSVVSPEIRD